MPLSAIYNTGVVREKSAFQEGDLAMLIDRKGRRYLVRLDREGALHTHSGVLPHQKIIGLEEGSWLHTTMGQTLLAVKPTLAEYVLHMPRTTQILYPKDLGNILVMADIFPGAQVVEAGLGSGALSMTLLRAVGPEGRVTTYEVRQEQVERALDNVRSFVPELSNLKIKDADIYQGIMERDVDRVVLDVPEPWHVVASAAESLKMGGIFLSFLPTVLQIHRLVQALSDDGRFQLIETVETLERPWHVSQRSVRPAHRMVAHSGFITTARRCAPKGPTGTSQQAEGSGIHPS